jgi:hypothetical protein
MGVNVARFMHVEAHKIGTLKDQLKQNRGV